MSSRIRYLWITCLHLLAIHRLYVIDLSLCLLQQGTHVIAILHIRLVVLGRGRPVVRAGSLIYNCGVSSQHIWWLLRIHFGISIFFWLDIRSSRGRTFSLCVLNNRLLLLIRLLLILISPRLIRVEALVLDLGWLLPGFVCTDAILGIQLRIYTLGSIPTGCVSDYLGLFCQHLYLLIFLLSFPTLRCVVVGCVILSDIDFVVAGYGLGNYFGGSSLVHGLHPSGSSSWHLRVWLLLAIDFFIHGLHQPIVCINGTLHIRRLDTILTLPGLMLLLLGMLLLLLNNRRLLKARMLIVHKAIAVLLVVARITRNQGGVHIWCDCPRLCDDIISRVSCLLVGLL